MSLGLSRKLILGLLVCACVMFIDGYDLSALPLALPYIVEAWGLPPAEFGQALSAVLLGLGVGALFLGPLGDRFGRRKAVLAGMIGLAVLTYGTGWAGDTGHFVIWRFLTGLALGLCLPNVTALVSEISPPEQRAFLLTLVSSAIAVGGICAGFIVPELVEHGGWPAAFKIPGLVIGAMVVAVWLFLPESPLWQSKAKQAAVFSGAGALSAPFQNGYAGAMFVFSGLYTLNAFALYMLLSWAAVILTQVDFSADQASRMTAFIQMGGLIAGLILALLLDRGRSVMAMMLIYLIVLTGLFLFLHIQPDFMSWSVLLLLAGGGIVGAHMAIMAIGTSFFPPQMLSAAIGVAVAIARLGAVAGPMAGSKILERGFEGAAFFPFIGIPIALCMVLTLFIPVIKRDQRA